MRPIDISTISFPKGYISQSPSKWVFVPKNYLDDPQPWIRFGASPEEYNRWTPEICGVCCLKMIQESYFGPAPSLWNMTQQLISLGGFRQTTNEIKGIYHYAIVSYLEQQGISSQMVSIPRIQDIYTPLQHGALILSINLSHFGYTGTHLILLYHGNPESQTFLLHDPSQLFNGMGEHISVSETFLEEISNAKGIFIY